MNDIPLQLQVVVIDDDFDHNVFITTLLVRAGYAVASFHDGMAAMEHIRNVRPSLVITDIFMPKMDGFEVLRHLRALYPLVPIIAMSGNISGQAGLYLESMRMLGAERTFRKPVSGFELLSAISALLHGSPAPVPKVSAN
jgi:CheY-like chemotaxis protein